jgi:hypothetical protein
MFKDQTQIESEYDSHNAHWRHKDTFEDSQLEPDTDDSPWTTFQAFMLGNYRTMDVMERWSMNEIDPSDKLNDVWANVAEAVFRNVYRFAIKTNGLEHLYDYLMTYGLERAEILQGEFESFNIMMMHALRNLHDSIIRHSNYKFMYTSHLELYLYNNDVTIANFIDYFSRLIKEVGKKPIYCKVFPMLGNKEQVDFPIDPHYYMFEVKLKH